MAAAISKAELFARLAGGHAAGITVVTPNRRLSQTLVQEFDAFQISKQLKVWEAADILPFDSLVERLYEDALYSGLAAELPLLLSPAQEQAIWEEVLKGADLLVASQAAADCRRAWELAHQWRIAGALGKFPGNEDAAAFSQWSRTYERRTAKEIDFARLPDLVAPLLEEAALRKPKLLVAYAFDVLPPQTKEFLERFEALHCKPERHQSTAKRTSFPDARQELEAAAGWARAKLEAGAKRIGVVVPELGTRRKEVARVFSRVMQPSFNLPGAARTPRPFNVSLGLPLSQYPVVALALSILGFSNGEISYEKASRLIRSPFIGGAEAEMAQRALLDADLRKEAPARLALGKLIGLIEACPVLRRCMEAVFSLKDMNSGSPHEWGRHFTALLAAAGYPGERALDSDEFQARAKFNETLAEFAKLERVFQKMSFSSAFSRLDFLCRETLFQPETPDAPIQVLGVLESAGLEFDALWVSGLTDAAWPLGARPNPFLPPALQRKAGIPQASADESLSLGKRITQGWQSAAREVVFSWPAMEQDRTLLSSPLISEISQGNPQIGTCENYRDVIFAARRLETVPDGQAPALFTRTPKGGTRILADQAACPFRAFARHRLAAEGLEEPAAGPDARARGKLLHTLMKELWTELKGSAGLQEDCSSAIDRAAAAAVRDAKLEEPFAALERKRLSKLAREWLEVERARGAFSVIKTEEKVSLAVANLQLNGRIDRMDRLEAGGYAVIDYKTGRPTPNEWLGERPDDPQLPLYALNAKEDISAVAFARLRTGEMRYMGFSDRKDLIPEVKPAQDWDALLAGWRRELDALGHGFASGEARVDPKDGLATCRYCDLQTLCRVYEKVNHLKDEEAGE
jgi:ATP-dependent helicase/nuclease subunit B